LQATRSSGAANVTFFTAMFPLMCLLAAAFLLLAVYGYIEIRRGAAGNSSAASNDSQRTSTAA
jgi:hypothetical protein